MAKVSKEGLTKDEWLVIKEQRKLQKQLDRRRKLYNTPIETPNLDTVNCTTAFVIGNGTSRKNIDLEKLKRYGKIYGCNALYRSFRPDYLIAVDVKMILEITKANFQKDNSVWTNPNRAYEKISNLNFFNPSKGWSSGPTALLLASMHQNKKIYILGFDYKGLEDGKKLNNIYADTPNYRKSVDNATFYGNWLRQTLSIVKEHKSITYFRVIPRNGFTPDEFLNCKNLKHIYLEDFILRFNSV